MIELHHDPKVKQQLKDMLYEFLYGPVQKQYQQVLQGIIRKNTQLLQTQHKSFIYKGVVYNMDTTALPRKMNRLTPALVPDMNAYLAEVTRLNTQEVPYVVGFITQVLNSSNNFQDYLQAFPSVLHPILEKVIASSPCRHQKLTLDEIQAIQSKNQKSIDLLKQRVVTNLII